MQPLEAGEPRAIGPYRLLGRLGAGGMGRVYLGRSAGGRTVAVKIVHPHFATDAEFRIRFRREVDAARRVGGEWTAPVLDADPDAEVPWVATGYVAGPSLDRAVASYGPLPEPTVRAIGAGLARALVAVHGLGLVHRDVKPSNVLLTLGGAGGAGGDAGGPRLIDFGIARATDGTASLTSTGVSIGSPGYMSPEQILGKGVTGASDVFSLGAVLAFAATGRPPFSGDNSATLLYKVVHEEPDLTDVPAPLVPLVAECLAKAAADRPAPQDVAQRLGDALGAPGWLPAPLVEEASRAAVRLLDLDAEDAGPGGGGAGASASSAPYSPTASSGGYGSGGYASGPYGPGPGPGSYGSGSYGSGPGGSGSGSGGFGAPDPSYGGPAGAVPVAAGPYGAPTETGGRAAGQVPGQRTGTPADAGPGGGSGGGTGGGRQVTMTAAGRRFSCTLVVAGAAAFALVLGGLWRAGVLPGTGEKDHSGGDAAARPPVTASSPAPPSASGQGSPAPSASAPAQDTVPQALIGTWKGTVTTNLGVPTKFEITIKAGRKGEAVGRDKALLDLFGTTYDCSGQWKLSSATDRSVVLDSTGNTNPHPGICADGSADERFTLNEGGSLHYKSGDRAAGNPEGDLTRSP
ncbi:serine/threonine-protein kinase [Streptomyces sp. WAC06614]|uniref:serine/threonine-protein kinase n=1 Tax=Streptomyces sp. WAC06614 TaxID=2487416 RepID=UPI000F7A24C9|nr:serine/threonine-protein kinase [Streptomyces sp. WAC06614]RSS83195.1 serine/threonine protein kinase [Streptomyces sp. WAC06614]